MLHVCIIRWRHVKLTVNSCAHPDWQQASSGLGVLSHVVESCCWAALHFFFFLSLLLESVISFYHIFHFHTVFWILSCLFFTRFFVSACFAVVLQPVCTLEDHDFTICVFCPVSSRQDDDFSASGTRACNWKMTCQLHVKFTHAEWTLMVLLMLSAEKLSFNPVKCLMTEQTEKLRANKILMFVKNICVKLSKRAGIRIKCVSQSTAYLRSQFKTHYYLQYKQHKWCV